MPYLRREQLAGMGIHYMYHSFDYFLKCQEELGFRTIEMWCGVPHFCWTTMDIRIRKS